MSRPRTFDYDEAKRRHEAGESIAAIARSLGVSDHAVHRAVDDGFRERADAYTKAWIQEQRQPCAGGCGRLVWMHQPGRSGLCATCWGASRRTAEHGSSSRAKRCKCDLCRAASTEARRAHRLATRVPCSHGCGTLVDRNPNKPPECRPCSVARINGKERIAA